MPMNYAELVNWVKIRREVEAEAARATIEANRELLAWMRGERQWYDEGEQRHDAVLEAHGLDIDHDQACLAAVGHTHGYALATLDPARFRIKVLSVENNYHDDRIPKLMAEKGYDVVGWD